MTEWAEAASFQGVCWLGGWFSGNWLPIHAIPLSVGPLGLGPPACLAESRSLKIFGLRFSDFNVLNYLLLQLSWEIDNLFQAELGVGM